MNEHDRSVMFGSKKMDWRTPPHVFEYIQRLTHSPFDLDAAANESNHLCPRWLGPGGAWEDALSERPWDGQKIWLNPPYGRNVGKWMEKAYKESLRPHRPWISCLIFARTDTRWWHDFAMRAQFIFFIRGRISFHSDEGPSSAAPAPSCLVRFSNRNGTRIGPSMGSLVIPKP